tara:strand:+ start:420 stop:1340 length:921 start_codon:yes stop_codon:yes gene_type:complete
MSYGFEATNNNNKVLISSETRNLHFLAKYSSPSVSNSASAYGGFKELSYTITSTVIPVPFFTMPTADYYGIIGVKNTTGNTWVVKMIKSGTNTTYPVLYVFVDARGVTSSESYGMQVLQNDGSASFDSRKEPLVITGGASVTHPSNPLSSSISGLNSVECGSGSSHSQHTPDNESSAVGIGSISSTPIYHYSSLAQAERRASFSGSEESCLGISAYGGCIGYGETDSWVSTYWAFYRGGIRRNGTNVYAGWVAVLGGCYWSSYDDNDFFGIDVGGGSTGGGSFPYSNETINLASTAVIVGDGTRYA